MRVFAAIVLSFCTGAFALAIDPSHGDDVVMMLPSSLLHLRIDVRQNGLTLEQVRGGYLDELMTTLDQDGDGRVSRDESRRSPFFNDAKKVSDNPFLQRLAARGLGPRDHATMSRDTIQTKIASVVGASMALRQNDSLAQSDQRVFETLDTDHSGSLDATEMRLAAKNIAARDSDTDQCVTFDEFFDQPTGDMMTMAVVEDEETPTMRADRLTTLRTTTAAKRFIDRMDRDRDQTLSADEIGWTPNRLATWDADNDGQLSAGEWVETLGRADRPECDFHVHLDLASGAAGMSVNPGGEAFKKRWTVTKLREGQFRIASTKQPIDVTISYRDFDPIAVAVDRAKLTMNELDQDANGYVESDEIMGRFRFESYLFAAMDRNTDDRLSESEMLDYVRDYVRPAASTCRVTLYDLGRGYFGQIDKSRDGRISIRELRDAEQNLRLQSDEPDHNLGGQFRIELSRGQMMPFGEIERPETEAPQAVLGDPVGPLWFQRMDRNTDGDLTWREFLGPRNIFDAYDVDNDGLIDSTEATATLE